MSRDIATMLEELRADYKQATGQPFKYFCCPILFRDERVALCKGHVINRAFPNSALEWVVQRKDVDNFYGSNFESDFAAILFKENRTVGDTVTDKALYNRFRPKIFVQGKQVSFFHAQRDIPTRFTMVEFDNDGQVTPIAMKMRPDDLFGESGAKWEIAVEKDVRIAAVVSLIKSAHLTLFALLSYNYALGPNGRFVGNNILGEFFRQNRNKRKPEVVRNAHPFFREYAPMVRPVESFGLELQGTISDKSLLICLERGAEPWAFIVFIKTSQSFHAVLIPFEQSQAVARFRTFLADETDCIEAHFARLDRDRWHTDEKPTTIRWPKTGFLFP